METTIQQVINTILQAVPGAPLEKTVDTFKSGDPTREITGIVTTFIVTCQVIEKAIELGANLIITHEPTYFNHEDELEWIQDDSVYQAKRKLLDEHQITVWRFHDHWHLHQPDGILTGFVRALGWEAYQDPGEGHLANIPPTSLSELVAFIKRQLDMPTIRVVGPLDLTCQRVAMILGSLPGKVQVDVLRRSGADVLICGETTEWQTCEYVRDAVASGQRVALIILGHEKSEEPGMKYLVEWLRTKVLGVPITHVPAGDPLQFV